MPDEFTYFAVTGAAEPERGPRCIGIKNLPAKFENLAATGAARGEVRRRIRITN